MQQNSSRPYRQTGNKRGLRKIFVVLLIVLLAMGACVYYYKYLRPRPGNAPASQGAGSSATNPKGEQQNSPTSVNPSPTSQPSDNKSNDSTGAALITPYGDFISAHHVTASTPIASICNTSPSASCVITFTANGTTKSLDPVTADKGGSAYWNNWTPEDIGLSAGTWHVRATATLAGQSKSADDANDLVVQ